MKIKLLLAATMACTVSFLHSVNAQINLVPNWSFEDTVACPNSLTQISYASGWSSYRQTPDYFNSCNGNGQAGVPSNTFGFQNALDGNAYAGFLNFMDGGQNYKEYIGTQLVQPLDSGTKYFVSFYVSRGAVFGANVATNKIGAKLSTVAFININPQPIDNSAQVFTDSIITDTLNWVKISGSFIADSAYQYLSIGNFFNDSVTTFIHYDSIGGTSYYYLDCVCISEDSLKCNGNVGIAENNLDFLINIFPNPVTNTIFIVNRTNDTTDVEIYNLLGKLISKNFKIGKKFSIDISDYSNGFYFLVLKQNERIIKKKIIKY